MLREHAPPIRLDTRESIGIVGGGVLGMQLALRLSKAGANVTLIEAAQEVGGLAASWSIGDVVWDKHYHVILNSDTATKGLLEELDLQGEMMWSTPQTGFFSVGRLHPMNGLVDFLRFPPLGIVDKLRLGLTILHGSRIKDGIALESIPIATWLRRWSGNRTYETVWQPLLRAKLGEEHESASAAFIWAIIARLYAARRLGLGREQFGYIKGGYARILGRMIEVLTQQGVRLELNAPVDRITTSETGQLVQTRRGPFSFDRVIVTLPARRAAAICEDLTESERLSLSQKRYQGIVCASVLLSKPLAPYYITNITESWVPFSAVIEMSCVVDPREFKGQSLVYLPKYIAPDDPLFNLTDEEIQERFLTGLARMYPGFKLTHVQAFRISRVREVFPIATLRYSASLPPIQTSVAGLLLANSAHIVNGTLNVNETLHVAQRAFAVASSKVGIR